MTSPIPPAQASDEPMRADFEAWMISEAQRQHPVEPLTEKEKEYVLRRNVWDKESYEGHDGAWQSWKAAYALYATPRATADMEGDAGRLDWLMANNSGFCLQIKGTEKFGWFIYHPISDTSSKYFASYREAIDAAMALK